jgi:hypothetical protein
VSLGGRGEGVEERASEEGVIFRSMLLVWEKGLQMAQQGEMGFKEPDQKNIAGLNETHSFSKISIGVGNSVGNGHMNYKNGLQYIQ